MPEETCNAGSSLLTKASLGFWSSIKQFDWLGIPGAVKAISLLVEGTAKSGPAWIEIAQAKGGQFSQAVRDTTKARSRSLEALTDFAIENGVQDVDLARRTLDYVRVKGLREQQNRESVGLETLDLIAEKPPAPPDTSSPDDDWMNIFASYAERASTVRMQKHWAAILASEIHKPGSFSFATLQIMSLMDREFAESIAKASAWVVDGRFIPMTPSKNRGDDYYLLLRLSALGVFSMGHSTSFDKVPRHHMRFVGETRIWMEFPKPFKIAATIVTHAGREILSIVEKRKDEEFVDEVIAFLEAKGAENVGRIQ